MYDKTFTNVLDRRELLRVKLKNLAQEAALIRREENRILWSKAGCREYSNMLPLLWIGGADTVDADVRTLRKLRRACHRKVGDYGLYLELHAHRTKHVRHHARMAHLAYGAIRGRTLAQMEGEGSVPLSDHQKAEVLRLYQKYGPKGAPVPQWMAVKLLKFSEAIV